MYKLKITIRRTLLLSLAALAVAWSAAGDAVTTWKAGTKPPAFSDVRAQAKEFIGYADSISLTPEQQKIKEQVLSQIPANCCKKFSMLTCCCPCNMAKSIWGLSNFMVMRGANAPELKAAVESWVSTIGKSGFTGDACFTGGCGRPFAKNGCGGMDQDHLVY